VQAEKEKEQAEAEENSGEMIVNNCILFLGKKGVLYGYFPCCNYSV
jgi:hypothetical protein